MDISKMILFKSIVIYLFFNNFLYSQNYIPDNKVSKQIQKKVIKEFKIKNKIKNHDIKKIHVLDAYFMNFNQEIDSNIIIDNKLLNQLEFDRRRNIFKKYRYHCFGVVYSPEIELYNEFELFTNGDVSLYALSFYGKNLLEAVKNYNIKYAFIISMQLGANEFLVDKNGNIFVLKDDSKSINDTKYEVIPLDVFKPILGF